MMFVEDRRRRPPGRSKDYFSRLYIIVHCYWVIGAPRPPLLDLWIYCLRPDSREIPMTSKFNLPPPLYTSYYKLLRFYWNVEPETTKLVATSDADRLQTEDTVDRWSEPYGLGMIDADIGRTYITNGASSCIVRSQVGLRTDSTDT